MKVLFISIALILCYENSQAQYLSDDGFTIGMSQDSAIKIIRSMGLSNLKETKKSMFGSRLIDGVLLFYVFGFCNDKLSLHRKDILPSIENLIFILKDLSSKYGNEFKTYTNISMTAVGEERSLSFLWREPLYRVDIIFNVFPNNNSLTIRYQTPGKCNED